VYSVKIEEGNVCLEMVNFRAARKDRYAEGLGSSQSSSIMASSDYNEHRQRAQGKGNMGLCTKMMHVAFVAIGHLIFLLGRKCNFLLIRKGDFQKMITQTYVLRGGTQLARNPLDSLLILDINGMLGSCIIGRVERIACFLQRSTIF